MRRSRVVLLMLAVAAGGCSGSDEAFIPPVGESRPPAPEPTTEGQGGAGAAVPEVPAKVE